MDIARILAQIFPASKEMASGLILVKTSFFRYTTGMKFRFWGIGETNASGATGTGLFVIGSHDTSKKRRYNVSIEFSLML